MLPQNPLSFIFHFIKKQKYKFLYLLLTSAMWAINDALFPYFIKHIVNGVQFYQGPATKIFAAVATPLIALIALWFVTEMAGRSQGIISIYLFPKFRAQIREAVLHYVKKHSHEYFANQFAGNIAKKLSDLPTSCQSIVENLCYQFMPATTGVVVVLVMMWATKPIFAMVILIWLILHMGFTAIFMRYGNQLWEVQSEAGSVLSGKIVDVLTNMLNVRLFARGDYEMEYLKTYQRDEIKKSQKAQWAIELVRIGLGISGLFLIFSMMFLLIYGYARHWVTLGDFTQVSMQSFWILGWIWFLSYQVSVFAREMGVVKNALTLIVQPHSIIDSPQAKQLQVKHGKISFDHVTFGYQKDQPIFNDLQIEILAGKKIGLVGFSGSGKSTFVNLMLRFYEPQQGKILIDEQNIAEVMQDSLRAQIAMIPQDPMLFHRSLMENIRYGRLDASDEEVIEASKLAHCHEFIEQLDEKYAALVGERGVKLSGGQRQRIAIARAILKQAPILILDEATSALDSVTEKLIQQSLQHLMKNCTTIVIAHRLSTLSNMDDLLVFDQGKIIECGTQAELLAANGHFAYLWKMQADGFLPGEGCFMIKKILQRYPDGVFSMLFIQMFSLVSFAMLFSLLTLYAVHVLHLSDQKAYDISAAFNAQTFAMAVLGGYIGNRFLGYRMAFIFSGILAIAGLALLLSTNLLAFYYGLAIYTMAQGIMVPAMFVLLGMLYEGDHPDRDSGFIISYIGMNIGSFIATMAAGPISERYGYWLAFLIGLIFAVLSLVNYLVYQYQFKPKKIMALTRAHADKIHFKGQCLGVLIVLMTIPALAYLIQMPQWNNLVLSLLGTFCLLLMIGIVLRQTDPLAKKRMIIFIFLNVSSLMFWALYLLMPTIMPLFTERNVNREILQHVVPTATFFASNPLLIMILGPLFSMMWLRLGQQGKTFSAASKFSLGFVLMALGYLALAFGVAQHNALGLMAWQWLIVSYFLQTSGELFVAPIGLAMVGTLAPREFEGLMMGVWQLSTGVAGVLTNTLSKGVNFDDKTALLPKLTMPAYQHLFLLCGSLMLGVALITLCLLPYLNRLNKGSYESILQ